MNWLERICKDHSQVRVGERDTRYDHNTAHNRGNKSQKQLEDEELDHAISLSFTGNNQRKAKGHDTDEDLARALQESMYLHASSSQATFVPAHHVGRRICKSCKKPIGSGQSLTAMGAIWHPQCFCCQGCDRPITDLEFSISGNHFYHKDCYKQLFHPKCDVCKDFIQTNRAGLIEYRVHPFWGQKYCWTHEMDSTPQCCSCDRIESKNAHYVDLGDGRKLCLECLQTSIMDTGECQPLYHEIRDFYEGMNMKIGQQVPMLLVERQALNEAIEGEKDGKHHTPETRGLCLSEEQTINTIFRRPRIGAGNKFIEMRTGPTRLTRRCEVTAILVLYGLPRLLTGSILAHELMHAWLCLNGFRNLRPEVEEGICQVLAHMWLESEVMAGSSSSSSSSQKSKAPKTAFDKKLGEFFLKEIAMHSSPVYGAGFRAGHASMVQYGLRRTLEHIRLTGGFPL